MLQFGFDFGGTTLATVEQTNYYTGYQLAKIRAGQGFNLEVGTAIENSTNDLEFQFLVGYKVDQESASNGSVTWDRIPFTGLIMLKKNKWKIGGGVSYHLNPELIGSFSGYDPNGKYFNDRVNDQYDNTVGGVIQVQYQATDAISIGLRGTFMEYTLKKDPSVKASGDSIGFNFSYTFGEESEFR